MDCGFTKCYTPEEIEALNKLHTKQLLRKLKVGRICGEDCRDYFTSSSPECEQCLANQKYNEQQLKAILATREHIPNKQESKALRKARIKKGR
jgi:hypothetical protein